MLVATQVAPATEGVTIEFGRFSAFRLWFCNTAHLAPARSHVPAASRCFRVLSFSHCSIATRMAARTDRYVRPAATSSLPRPLHRRVGQHVTVQLGLHQERIPSHQTSVTRPMIGLGTYTRSAFRGYLRGRSRILDLDHRRLRQHRRARLPQHAGAPEARQELTAFAPRVNRGRAGRAAGTHALLRSQEDASACVHARSRCSACVAALGRVRVRDSLALVTTLQCSST